jgi:hypothetical protein
LGAVFITVVQTLADLTRAVVHVLSSMGLKGIGEMNVHRYVLVTPVALNFCKDEG